MLCLVAWPGILKDNRKDRESQSRMAVVCSLTKTKEVTGINESRRNGVLFEQRDEEKLRGLSQKGTLAVFLALLIVLRPKSQCYKITDSLSKTAKLSISLPFSQLQVLSLRQILAETFGNVLSLFSSDSSRTHKSSTANLRDPPAHFPSRCKSDLLSCPYHVSQPKLVEIVQNTKNDHIQKGKRKNCSRVKQRPLPLLQPCKPKLQLPCKTDILPNSKQAKSTAIFLSASPFPVLPRQSSPQVNFSPQIQFEQAQLQTTLINTNNIFSIALNCQQQAPNSSRSEELTPLHAFARHLEAFGLGSVLQVEGGEQIYNQQESLKMNFGPPAICPPCFYFFFLPAQYCLLPQEQPQEGSSHSEPSSAELASGEERIVVTRQDLLAEGYEQTKKAWTEEEDQLLLRLCANKQSRFEEIAAAMPSRNAKMCYSRFRRLTNHSKDCWSKDEDARLSALVDTYGETWRDFQPSFPNRNYKQLKDHYENYLRPDLRKDDWTVQDDLLLIKLINQHGKNWRIIEAKMPGRSRNQLKNRYFGRIKRLNSRKMAARTTDDISSGNKLSLLPL